MRLRGYEAMKLWGYEAQRLWGCEADDTYLMTWSALDSQIQRRRIKWRNNQPSSRPSPGIKEFNNATPVEKGREAPCVRYAGFFYIVQWHRFQSHYYIINIESEIGVAAWFSDPIDMQASFCHYLWYLARGRSQLGVHRPVGYADTIGVNRDKRLET